MPDGSTEFCTSNNNLRQIPDVKAGLDIRVVMHGRWDDRRIFAEILAALPPA